MKFILLLTLLSFSFHAFGAAPLYKPSSRSEKPIDISSNDYGHHPTAPKALGIGETAPDFLLQASGSGTYSLYNALKTRPVAIIFYRGHW